MEMRSPAETVAHHLDQHQPWFQRCEATMTVREMDDQTYVLTLGQFGNFGFELNQPLPWNCYYKRTIFIGSKQ